MHVQIIVCGFYDENSSWKGSATEVSFRWISPLSYVHDNMYTAFVFVYMFINIYFYKLVLSAKKYQTKNKNS